MKKIKLTNSDKECYVSDEDFEFVSQWKWRLDGKYVSCTKNLKVNDKYKICFLHRAIYEHSTGQSIPQSSVIDHIDGNPLNNTRENLRLATKSQNAHNHRKYKNNSSGFIGVTKYMHRNKHIDGNCSKSPFWYAEIRFNYKRIGKIFPFTDEGKIAAAKWRDQKAKELHGEFAILNFPDT